MSYRQNKILDGGNLSFGINVSYHFGSLMKHREEKESEEKQSGEEHHQH